MGERETARVPHPPRSDLKKTAEKRRRKNRSRKSQEEIKRAVGQEERELLGRKPFSFCECITESKGELTYPIHIIPLAGYGS